MPADPITSGIGTAIGIIGSVGKLFGNAKANRQLGKLQASDPNYGTSAQGIQNNAIAGNRMALAGTILNSKMPGSAAIERGIYANQANQAGNIDRNATSGEQALALGAGNIGQTNDAFMKQGENQADYYKWATNNLQGAQQGMINENNANFQDQTRRFEDKAQIQGAMNANRQNSWGSVANAGFALADFGMNGGMTSMFGGGGGNNGTQIPSTF